MRTSEVTFSLNGDAVTVDVGSSESLLDVLRDTLGLMGTKKGCEAGNCGACTVLMNGAAVNSCLVMAPEIEGARIVTIEGIANDGSLHPIQQAFIEFGAVQCGYCSPGMIMSAKALLDENPSPDEPAVRRAIAGNLCRCTGYAKIVEAIMSLAQSTTGGE